MTEAMLIVIGSNAALKVTNKLKNFNTKILISAATRRRVKLQRQIRIILLEERFVSPNI